MPKHKLTFLVIFILILVSCGDNTTSPNIDSKTVYGKVVDENGKGIEDVDISIYLLSDYYFYSNKDTTDSKGKYAFYDLENGDYKIYYHHSNYTLTPESIEITKDDNYLEIQDIIGTLSHEVYYEIMGWYSGGWTIRYTTPAGTDSKLSQYRPYESPIFKFKSGTYIEMEVKAVKEQSAYIVIKIYLDGEEWRTLTIYSDYGRIYGTIP